MSNYWKKRYDDEMLFRQKSEVEENKELLKIYQRHFNEIAKEIELLQSRYMVGENIPPSELRKRVNAMDIESFKDKAKRYVKEKNFSDKANAELKLYNLKMKVNRLALLQYNIDLEIIALINAEEKLAERILNKKYFDELKFQAGILGEHIHTPKNEVSTIVKNTFYGANWSNRIWTRQNLLRDIVAKSVEDLLVRGRNPTTLIPKLKKEFEVSRQEARRLLVTEGARVQTEAQKLTYKENGFEEYIYLAEPSACLTCSALDDKIFKVSNMQPGINASPMHPHCHCSTAPYVDREKQDKISENSVQNSYESGIIDYKDIKTLREFEKHRENWFNQYVKPTIQDVDIEIVSKKLKKVFQKSKFAARFKIQNLDSLIESSRFMNQFETNTSGGTISTKYRKQATEKLFGISTKGLRKKDFEKYGYIGDNDVCKDIEFNQIGGVNQYGDIIVHFNKEKVKNRVTFTIDNSLGPSVTEQFIADNPNNPKLVGIGKYYLEEFTKILKDKDFNSPNDISSLLSVRYVEAQYHGELLLSDVSSMYFTEKKPTPEQIFKLTEKNIKLFYKEGEEFVQIK